MLKACVTTEDVFVVIDVSFTDVITTQCNLTNYRNDVLYEFLVFDAEFCYYTYAIKTYIFTELNNLF